MLLEEQTVAQAYIFILEMQADHKASASVFLDRLVELSTGSECSVIIEDGTIAEEPAPAPKWKEGTF